MSQLYIYKNALNKIIENKKIKDAGGYIGIPFPFESLNRNLGAIQQGTYYLVTANSGISKSKFTRYVFIYSVYKFYVDTGYPVQIIYLPLEDSTEEVMFNMMCFYLKDKYNMNITAQHLAQLGEYNLSNSVVKKLEEAEGYFADLFSILTIVDSASTPSQILNIGKSWAESNGEIKQKLDKSGNSQIVSYKKTSNVHTIFMVDNYSNIDTDTHHKSHHEAVSELSRNIARKIFVKKFGFTYVAVQQQSQAKEKVQYANNGRLLYEKFEPSLGDLADVLTTQRDCHVALGLFSPERYGLEEYWNYNIKALSEFFRSVKILKSNRSAAVGKIIPLWFEGGVEYYEQLPFASGKDSEGKILPPSPELVAYYQKAQDIRSKKSGQQLKILEG